MEDENCSPVAWPSIEAHRRWSDRQNLVLALDDIAKNAVMFRPFARVLDAPVPTHSVWRLSHGLRTLSKLRTVNGDVANVLVGLTPHDRPWLLEPVLPDCGALHFYCVRKIVRYAVYIYNRQCVGGADAKKGIKLVNKLLPTLEWLR